MIMIKELTITMLESTYDEIFEHAQKALEARGKDDDSESVKSLVRIAFTAGCIPNVCAAIDWITSDVCDEEDYEPSYEDKQQICDALAETLKLTRNCEDIIRIKYNPDTECAEIYSEHSEPVIVNVEGDSGTALIQDIMRRLP